MEVLNIEVDLYNYNDYLSNNQKFYDSREDYQVITKYIDKYTFSVLIKRLDKDEGWNKNLDVLIVYNNSNNNKSIVNIGTSDVSLKEVIVNLYFEIYESSTPLNFLPSYNIIVCGEPKKLTRLQFNELFNTDIGFLPCDMYAFGLHNKEIFVYSDHCLMYYEIIRQVNHIFNIALTFTEYNDFYFLITCYDGYLEKTYNNNNRIIPKHIISESICNYSSSDIILDDNEAK